jgi:hypothetical protein
MKTFAIPAIAAVLVLAAAAGGAYALTSDDAEPTQATRESAEDSRCAAESPDCVDPNTVVEGDNGDAFGICIEGTADCVDTPTNPDEPVSDEPVGEDFGVGHSCLVEAPDCNDTPADQPLSEPNSGAGGGSSGSLGPDEIVAKVSDDLSSRTGAEAVLVSLEAVDWPDTSLGNPEPTAIYAQVITPGYLIIVESGGAQYEYHTDTTGNFTLLD